MPFFTNIFFVPHPPIYVSPDDPKQLELPLEEKGVVVDGLHCSKCKDYTQYAAPNQPDGTFKCFPCRSGY